MISDLFVLFSQLYEVNLLLESLNAESTLLKLIYVAILECRLAVLYLALFVFARSHLLVGTFYIVAVKLFLVKLDQVETYIAAINHQPNEKALAERRKSSISKEGKFKSVLLANHHQLTTAQEHYISTLRMISRMNGFFGKSFFAFLAATIPLNCLLVSTLIFTSGVSPFAAFFVVVIAMQESACHLFIHLLVAHLNKRILAPVKIFLRVYYQKAKFLHTAKQKLKCAHFIEAFWCRKSYGLSYYKFGKISMFSFFKVCEKFMSCFLNDHVVFIAVCCSLHSTSNVDRTKWLNKKVIFA